MALTRSFKELVQWNVVANPAFGEALLRDEGIGIMLTGDVDTEQRQRRLSPPGPSRCACAPGG
jgi:hypothetical protein